MNLGTGFGGRLGKVAGALVATATVFGCATTAAHADTGPGPYYAGAISCSANSTNLIETEIDGAPAVQAAAGSGRQLVYWTAHLYYNQGNSNFTLDTGYGWEPWLYTYTTPGSWTNTWRNPTTGVGPLVFTEKSLYAGTPTEAYKNVLYFYNLNSNGSIRSFAGSRTFFSPAGRGAYAMGGGIGACW